MGNCFGQTGWSWKLSRSSTDDDQDMIINNGHEGPNDRSIFRLLKFRGRRITTPKLFNRLLTSHRSPISNYVELERGANAGGQPQGGISLQYLDAKSLLLLARSEQERQMQYREFGTANSSQYGSSLDLEWENEKEYGGPASMASNQLWVNIKPPQFLPDKSPSSHSSESEKKDRSIECAAKVHERKASWSHISTPDSMEWDVVTEDNRLKAEDCDSVEDLLNEIEQLKNRALEETGQFDYDLNKYSAAEGDVDEETS